MWWARSPGPGRSMTWAASRSSSAQVSEARCTPQWRPVVDSVGLRSWSLLRAATTTLPRVSPPERKDHAEPEGRDRPRARRHGGSWRRLLQPRVGQLRQSLLSRVLPGQPGRPWSLLVLLPVAERQTRQAVHRQDPAVVCEARASRAGDPEPKGQGSGEAREAVAG
jgi:hypothetical protein